MWQWNDKAQSLDPVNGLENRRSKPLCFGLTLTDPKSAELRRATPHTVFAGAVKTRRENADRLPLPIGLGDFVRMYPDDPCYGNEKSVTALMKQGVYHDKESGMWYRDPSKEKRGTRKDGSGDRTNLQHQMAVPAGMVNSVLSWCHDTMEAGHPGKHKMYAKVRSLFWWPTWREDVDHYIATCLKCQVNKPRNRPLGKLHPLESPDGCFQSWSMDFISGLPETEKGYTAVLVMVDRFSKLVHLQPTTTECSAEEAAAIIQSSIYRLHGQPLSFVSNRDGRLT